MKPFKKSSADQDDSRFNAPWERAFNKIITPFEEFVQHQTTGSIVLMVCTAIALVLANSSLAEAYKEIIETPISIGVGSFALEKTLHHWVNDGLMTFFFFVVGLEIKRAILVGELSSPRKAALPIIAAIGGMVAPALIYFAINPDGDAARGWGIPMATDIAFAVGALVLLGPRIPKALVMFLVALAIVDDLGAVLVIAVFYTEQIAMNYLGIAAGLLGVLVIFNLGGIRHPLPYFLVACALWFMLLKSGVHSTIAGVLGAFTIPARPKYDPSRFSQHVRALMDRFDASHRADKNILTNDTLHSNVQTLEHGAMMVSTLLQRLEHLYTLPVALLVIPVFALVNAGVSLEWNAVSTALGHPVTLGVIIALVAGKFIGITGTCWLALKFGIGQLPEQTELRHIAGVSLLAGIGFTMSIFIAELGFAENAEHLLMAKTGILAASVVAGVCGCLWLLATTRRPA